MPQQCKKINFLTKLLITNYSTAIRKVTNFVIVEVESIQATNVLVFLVRKTSIKLKNILGRKQNDFTNLELSFDSVAPDLSLVSSFTTCYFNKGAICLGVHVQAGSKSVICGGLLILYQELLFIAEEGRRKKPLYYTFNSLSLF